MSRFARHGALFIVVLAVLAGAATVVHDWLDETPGTAVAPATPSSVPDGTSTTPATSSTSTTTSSTTTTAVPVEGLADPTRVGLPWSSTVPGVLTYRGNPTRSFYGTGPIPRTTPSVIWNYPSSKMCGTSSEYGNVRTWCGTGWTGQPAVFERDGRTWVVFGAYDYRIHFVDGATGQAIIPPFATGDLAKGNVTIDPDGYPLAYVGSRDNELRVIAFDGAEPRELFSIDGRTADRLHNDDWDGAPLVLDDHLLAGGENSWFVGYRLNRAYAADGTVTVAPTQVFRVPGWDDQLIADLGSKDPRRVSLESSVMVTGDTAWLNSSGGLLQGWDLSSLRTGVGEVTRTFRFWTGDDSDATVVADAEGFLYVGVEIDRANSRAAEVGQMLKIDPRRPDDPVVWSVKTDFRVDDGVWTAPIVTDEVVIWTSKPGWIWGIDRATGAVLWKQRIQGPALSSPVLVDGVLVQGDGAGVLHAYDLSSPRTGPTELWTVALGGNIESTPAVWGGKIYVGTRGGFMVCIG